MRAEVIRLAQAWLEQSPIVLDTETTGLWTAHIRPKEPEYGLAEPIEIAAVDAVSGARLFHSRVRPTIPISSGAKATHGIADEDLAEAPTMKDLLPGLRPILANRLCLTYHTQYDCDVMERGLAVWGLPWPSSWGQWDPDVCIMRRYWDFYGEPYQSLRSAMEQCGLRWEGSPHSALGDTLAARAILQYMAAQSP